MTDSKDQDLKTLEALNAKYFSSLSDIGDIDFRNGNSSNFSPLSVQPTAPPPSAPPAPLDMPPNAPQIFTTPTPLNLPTAPVPSAPPLSAVFLPPPSPSAPPAAEEQAHSGAPTYSHLSQSYTAAQSSHTVPSGHQSQAHSTPMPTYPQPGAFGDQYTSAPYAYASTNFPVWYPPQGPPTFSGVYPPLPQGSPLVAEVSPPHIAPGEESYPGSPPPPPPPPAPPHPQAPSQSSPHLQPHSPAGAYGAPPSASAPNLAQHPSVQVNTAPSSPGNALHLRPVGFFKDLLGHVEALPAARVVGADEAAARVVALKQKLNELQKKRESYHARQAGNAGAAAATAIFTGGVSLLLQGPAAVHQRNRLQQIIRAMREVIVQINLIRAEYGAEPGWDGKEEIVKISDKVFTKGLRRRELLGAL